MKASIVIVTRNRAEQLRETLRSLGDVSVPQGVHCELLVIDNASTDGTANVVNEFRHLDMSLRHLIEEKQGKSFGMNRAFHEANGEVILSADDDVRFPHDWIRGMIDPIASGRADAAAGGVELAPKLLQPWMTEMHRSWLAETVWLERKNPQCYVGANMAIARSVLEKVPQYDPQLGPGALGYCDDVLFSSQLIRAGYHIADCMDVCVEHHPDEARLSRDAWLEAARSRGLSQAYVGHHWEHWRCRFGKLRMVRAMLRMNSWRMTHPHELVADGCDENEMRLVFELATVEGHLNESVRDRVYEKNGLLRSNACDDK